jgi:hypothetical protein
MLKITKVENQSETAKLNSDLEDAKNQVCCIIISYSIVESIVFFRTRYKNYKPNYLKWK